MSPEPLPRVSIVIPTCAGAATLEAAVRCVLESDYPDFEVIVVNNGADAPTQAAIGRLPAIVRVVRSEQNVGFAGGNNLGVRESTGSVVALLNDDTEVRPDWLRKLTGALIETPGAGLAASLILEPDGKTLQHTGSQPLPNLLNAHLDKGKPLEEAPKQIVEREYIMGAAVALRKDFFAALGGLPECYFPGYYEDFELCHRVRAAGLKIIVEPSARLIHREKQSTRSEQDYLRFYHRHRWLFILRNLGMGQILRALACGDQVGIQSLSLEGSAAHAAFASGLWVEPGPFARNSEEPVSPEGGESRIDEESTEFILLLMDKQNLLGSSVLGYWNSEKKNTPLLNPLPPGGGGLGRGDSRGQNTPWDDSIAAFSMNRERINSFLPTPLRYWRFLIFFWVFTIHSIDKGPFS